MGKYLEPKCRLCRREGEKLYLKGSRCNSMKCSIEKKKSIPGGRQRTRKPSEYALMLREKQKVKRHYQLHKKQFHKYFVIASRKQGKTGDVLLNLLESRLDNVVYRAGLGKSRHQARQLVLHEHFLVNGRKVNVPSYQVRESDEICVREGSAKLGIIIENNENAKNTNAPDWMNVDTDSGKIIISGERNRSGIPIELNERLVVELYSK